VRPSLQKAHHKKGLVGWLKVEVLSSNPSTVIIIIIIIIMQLPFLNVIMDIFPY
jgi:uncharacterized membrane protein (DUF441 family)